MFDLEHPTACWNTYTKMVESAMKREEIQCLSLWHISALDYVQYICMKRNPDQI